MFHLQQNMNTYCVVVYFVQFEKMITSFVSYYTLHVSRNMQIVVEMTFIMYSLIQKSRQVEFVFNHSEIFTIIIPSKMIKLVFILAIVVGLSF